jgi:hypothetical protein
MVVQREFRGGTGRAPFCGTKLKMDAAQTSVPLGVGVLFAGAYDITFVTKVPTQNADFDICRLRLHANGYSDSICGGCAAAEDAMEFVTEIAPSDLAGIRLLGESGQFAIYATGRERYLLVQRHTALPWTGLVLSGDAIFRFSELLGAAGRDLYHEVAVALSPLKRTG